MRPLLTHTQVEQHTDAQSLVVVLHGISSDRRQLDGVIGLVRQSIETADVLAPRWRWLSFDDPTEIAEALVDLISRTVKRATADGRPYKRILLIGHSTGTLLLRKAFAYACGEYQDGPRAPQLRAPEAWVWLE